MFLCTLTTDCDRPGWDERRDMTALGAGDFVTRNTVDECLDYCEGDVSCVGVDVDYDRNPKRCWPHTNSVNYLEDNIYGQPGTTSYQLLTRCMSDTTTPFTTGG